MNRSELNSVFWQAVSLWINDAENNTYAIQPADYCVIGYDGNDDLIITSWLYTQVTEPTITVLETYTLEEVNNYWDRITLIPQQINEYSNVYTFTNGVTKNDIPTSLLNNGSICVDGSNVYILISNSWHQVTLS